MEGLKVIIFVLLVTWFLGVAFMQYVINAVESPNFSGERPDMTPEQYDKARIFVIFWPFALLILILIWPFVELSKRKS